MAFPLIGALMNGLRLGATGLGMIGGTPVGAARIAGGSLNLLKQAYTPNAMGLMNLGMDAIPLVTDIANNDVGLKSFSGFGGTLAGTKFGGRELNKLGTQALEDSKTSYIQNYTRNQIENEYRGSSRAWQRSAPASKELAVYNPKFRDDQIDRAVRDEIKLPLLADGLMNQSKLKETSLLNDPQYSRQGYNMAIGMGADVGLYSLTSGLGKPKQPPEVEAMIKQQEFSNSPVSRYMQMTGML